MRTEHYKTIAEEIAAAIRSGALPAGTRLPTHRELARERGIAVATVSRVYAQLTAAGLVSGEVGRGSFVRDQSGYSGLEPRRLPLPTRVADLSFNQPLAPGQGETLRRALRELANEGDLEALLAQHPPGGREHDRAAVATYLLDRGVDVPPGNVLVTSGAQQAIDVAAAALLAPGAVMAVDAVTYPGAKLVSTARHVELAAVRCDADGTDVDELEALCARRAVSVLYLMPTVHNPLGFVLGTEHRERIAALARQRDLMIIEDATYAFLESVAPPPLQALAPERTVYVGSLSKNLATGLRFGYLVAPDHLLSALTRALRTSTWGSPSLITTLVTRWLRDGTVEKLEAERRADAQWRQAAAREAFADVDYIAHPAGYSGWLPLPEETRADQVAACLAEHGILVSTGDAFAVPPFAPNALRLALASVAGDRLGVVLRQVAEAVVRG
ncbi:DNA-binding transcriptional MocR family regulator [Catenulispora sp. MAP5-51]|uniref:aminotransferase-like domain-containing protein n=1 Tax=Catenulispora sp. MAP5-51 TaxID=3156298 RepID=UPI003519AA3D